MSRLLVLRYWGYGVWDVGCGTWVLLYVGNIDDFGVGDFVGREGCSVI